MLEIPKDLDLLSFLGEMEGPSIKPMSTWEDDIIARMNGEQRMVGDTLPWSKTHNLFRMRPREVTLWAGVNGQGKSQVLGQVCAWSMVNRTWCLASMEMPPASLGHRMLRQVSGNAHPSDAFIRKWLHWTDARLWVYDQTDSVEPKRILGLVNYAGKELGCQHIAIDSLVKCGIAPDNYPGQTEFVDGLCRGAKYTGSHVHLVHHLRKGEKESQVPDKFDVKGAGEIADLVDNIILVWRNKPKEAVMEKQRRAVALTTKEERLLSTPDCVLNIVKQRHGEWEGRISLWFHRPSQSYTPTPAQEAMYWDWQ